MKHLIIFTNPNPNSFSASVKNMLIELGKEKKIETEVRDLYQLKFNPVLSPSDFDAFKKGSPPSDIKVEQELIKSADLISFVYPIWWAGPPALLKGYIDRVLSYGFAYSYGDKGPIPLLTGKKVSIINSHGTPSDIYQDMGMHQAMNLGTEVGIFGFCGMEIVNHKYFGAVPHVTEDKRKEMILEAKNIYQRLL